MGILGRSAARRLTPLLAGVGLVACAALASGCTARAAADTRYLGVDLQATATISDAMTAPLPAEFVEADCLSTTVPDAAQRCFELRQDVSSARAVRLASDVLWHAGTRLSEGIVCDYGPTSLDDEPCYSTLSASDGSLVVLGMPNLDGSVHLTIAQTVAPASD